MGVLDGHRPGERLIRIQAPCATLIDHLTLVAEDAAPAVAQAASRAIDLLRGGASSVSVDGVEYRVVED